ncbi:MAG: hypothetical protein WD872_20750, partial [Pirellulaceae bacterium]
GMGGGMGGMGGGGMGGGGMGGGGMFNVPAEKVGKLKLVSVCLDHGKADPNPRVPYELVPIETYAKSAEVTEVCKMLAQGQLDQHSAQAAVWHLQNGLSWEELATKIARKDRLTGRVERYFSPAHLQRALVAARVAGQRAEAASTTNSLVTSIGETAAGQ